ncbi:hypothetical protein [Megalodesulfovibrio gigas]|uniref:hypothetical protein n=1 Tax=Megalodesulfovibrio gigas TaxID=879 RepID=UPI001186E732|nr:hypothetical protein [Megalodesulfovibrio gigas]
MNVFAWVEGGEVMVEGSFSRGNPARGAAVEAFVPGQDAPVFRGETNAAGLVRFPLPVAAHGQELRIIVNAGEGHRNEWLLSAQETGAIAPTTATADTAPAVEPPALAGPAGVAGLALPEDRDRLKALVAEAVRAELAPLQHQVTELQRQLAQPGPSVQDITAGIGFLFGLAGVAMLVKRKR